MKFPALICLTLLLASCATTERPPTSAAKRSKAYVAGEPVPAMSGRKPELVPGELPARVRYHFADDDVINRLAVRLESGLQSGDVSLYDNIVLVHPGAWAHLKTDVSLDVKEAALMSMLNPANGLDGGLQGRVFRSKRAVDVLSSEMSKRLQESGGFRVRALRTTEMAKWWIYIGFDIEEPTFVVESNGGRYRFVVVLLKDRIFSIDELNALPGEG